MSARFFLLSLGSGSGRIITETWEGCIVPLTTLMRSSFNASRSVLSLKNTCKMGIRRFGTPYEQVMRRSLTRLNTQLANEFQSLPTPQNGDPPQNAAPLPQ